MQMLLVIGNRNYSSWSLRPWLALAHTGAEFEEIVIPLSQPNTAEEIRRHSPTGRVPVLKDGDVVVWDSLAICEYLHEKFPKAKLWPQHTAARALARSVVAEMHSGFVPLRTLMPMNIRLRRHKEPTPDVERDIARIVAIWADLRNRFGRSGPYLFGEFSIADCFYAPIAARFVTYGVKVTGAANEYLGTLLAHPAMQDWMDKARKEPWSEPQYD
jgi:glutathione S-transferase